MAKSKNFTYSVLYGKVYSTYKPFVKIANNTTAELFSGGCVVIKYHGNRIAVLTEKSIQLFHTGWTTYTTKERLNWFIQSTPFAVCQKSSIWYLWNRETGAEEEFKDGVTLALEDGKWKVDDLPF